MLYRPPPLNVALLTPCPRLYDPTILSRLLVVGDFSYSNFFSPVSQNAPESWSSWLDSHFVDCLTSPDSIPDFTFRRGVLVRSHRDHIYASHALDADRFSGSVDFINPSWTDHDMLSVVFYFKNTTCGKEIWRANPLLARNKGFRSHLSDELSRLHPRLLSHNTVQEQWDTTKEAVSRAIKHYNHDYVPWRQAQLKSLQSKRNRILRSRPMAAVLAQLLPTVEKQISVLQTESTDIAALCAGQRWRELGECSAGYLKRTIAARATARQMSTLQHPHTGNLCHSPSEMQEAANLFYQELYTPDPVNESAVADLLVSLPSSARLSVEEQEELTTEFMVDELLDGVKRTPRRSSPGPDGLSYEILSLIFRYPLYSDIFLKIYNDTLPNALFPASWSQTCMRLLPKKGDLTSLKNWRPISLVNCDAKVSTRLINNRIISTAKELINPYQTGFLPGRFIADNGLMLRLAMEQAQLQGSEEVGILLDQEKAYDRIHPEYLTQALRCFGFPPSLIASIAKLFFQTAIHININGFLTVPILQKRELRQGDPLSPILFNLAFEPFLRRVISDIHFRGFPPWNPFAINRRATTAIKNSRLRGGRTNLSQKPI